MPGSYGSGTRVEHRISPCSFGNGGPEGRESAKVNRLEDLRCGFSLPAVSREHRPALAMIMPDGTVIARDAFPASMS